MGNTLMMKDIKGNLYVLNKDSQGNGFNFNPFIIIIVLLILLIFFKYFIN